MKWNLIFNWIHVNFKQILIKIEVNFKQNSKIELNPKKINAKLK